MQAMENVVSTIGTSNCETKKEIRHQGFPFLSVRSIVNFDRRERECLIENKISDAEKSTIIFEAYRKRDFKIEKVEDDDHNTSFLSNTAYPKMESEDEEQSSSTYPREESDMKSKDDSLSSSFSSDTSDTNSYYNIVSEESKLEDDVNNDVSVSLNDNPDHDSQADGDVYGSINQPTSNYFEIKSQEYQRSVKCVPEIKCDSGTSLRAYLDHIFRNGPVKSCINQKSHSTINYIIGDAVINCYDNSNLLGANDAASSVDEFTKSIIPSTEDSIIQKIREWAISHNISKEQVDDLLQILRQKILPNAPVSGEALMESGLSSAVAITCPEELITLKACELLMNKESIFFDRGYKSLFEKYDDAEKIDKMMKRGHNIINCPMNYIQFTTKYRIKLPIESVKIFEHFDQKVKTDPEFYNDLRALIVSQLSEFYTLQDALLPIMKLILSEKVMAFFLLRRRTVYLTKMAFFKTAFSDCLYNCNCYRGDKRVRMFLVRGHNRNRLLQHDSYDSSQSRFE
ncbi:uncharacterized protein LOC100677948 isoform X1 [Nasonia vitripennis]|uniref:Uncharacterized protein n=1 Tax=Nasonia vitripennis TaxID=7425 RepID=A0A7M7IUV2_NASVI|nr:uncharacterized protein LOC100677948 isoform X1 [Nasonia vitripennis]